MTEIESLRASFEVVKEERDNLKRQLAEAQFALTALRGRVTDSFETCDDCEGTGRYPDDPDNYHCEFCNGYGWMPKAGVKLSDLLRACQPASTPPPSVPAQDVARENKELLDHSLVGQPESDQATQDAGGVPFVPDAPSAPLPAPEQGEAKQNGLDGCTVNGRQVEL